MRKENYLTPENVEEKVKSWFLTFEEYRGGRQRNIQPLNFKNAALLVIDIQKYFTQSVSHAFVPSSGLVICNINALTGFFKNNLVIYTKHVDDENSRMQKWWGNRLLADNQLAELDERIKVIGPVCIKSTYSAFYKTGLEELFEQNHIERVFVTGLLTNLCCETTAREAFVRGYEVFFVADATATYNEQLHFATLLNLSHGFARIVTTDEILGGRRDEPKKI